MYLQKAPLQCLHDTSQRVTPARPSPHAAIAVLLQPHSEWGLEQCQFHKSQTQKDRASLKWPHIDLHHLYSADRVLRPRLMKRCIADSSLRGLDCTFLLLKEHRPVTPVWELQRLAVPARTKHICTVSSCTAQMANLKQIPECHTATKHLQGNADLSNSESTLLRLCSSKNQYLQPLSASLYPKHERKVTALMPIWGITQPFDCVQIIWSLA